MGECLVLYTNAIICHYTWKYRERSICTISMYSILMVLYKEVVYNNQIQLPLHLLCYGLSPFVGRTPGDLCTFSWFSGRYIRSNLLSSPVYSERLI